MSIQNVYGYRTADEKLGLEWEALGKPVAISAQVALDSEFTEEARTFVLYKEVRMCALDIGPGRWYYRVGAWVGTENDGVIEWSGIYGPVEILSQKTRLTLSPFPTVITNVKPVYNGVSFQTGMCENYYIIINCTDKEHFKASGLKTYYKHDYGNGTFQVSNLDPDKTYSFQLQMFGGGKRLSILPRINIHLLTEAYIVENKRAAMPVKASTTTQNTIFAADRAILQEVVEKNKRNFSSHAEYLQYKAARARTSLSQ